MYQLFATADVRINSDRVSAIPDVRINFGEFSLNINADFQSLFHSDLVASQYTTIRRGLVEPLAKRRLKSSCALIREIPSRVCSLKACLCSDLCGLNVFVVGNTGKLCEIFGIHAFKYGRAFCHSMLPRVFGIGVLLEWSNVANYSTG